MRREDLDAGEQTDAAALAAEVAEHAFVEEARESRDVKRPTTTWEVRETRANSSGVYYSLNVKTSGGLIAPVTVKHSTRHDTMICLTCLTNDRCPHARFVRRYLERHPEELSA